MSGREMNDLWLSSQSHSALAKAAAARNASQRDERIVQQLHKVCQGKRSLCCLEKIRTEDQSRALALVRGA